MFGYTPYSLTNILSNDLVQSYVANLQVNTDSQIIPIRQDGIFTLLDYDENYFSIDNETKAIIVSNTIPIGTYIFYVRFITFGYYSVTKVEVNVVESGSLIVNQETLLSFLSNNEIAGIIDINLINLNNNVELTAVNKKLILFYF